MSRVGETVKVKRCVSKVFRYSMMLQRVVRVLNLLIVLKLIPVNKVKSSAMTHFPRIKSRTADY